MVDWAGADVRYTIEFGEDPDVTVTTSGPASMEGLIAFVTELAGDPRFRAGMSILVDHTALDTRPLSAGDIREVSKAVVRLDSLIGNSLVAIVVPDSLTFGYSRMYELLAEAAQVTSRPFYSRSEALDWLTASGNQGTSTGAPPN